MVVSTSPSFSRYSIEVFPAESRPEKNHFVPGNETCMFAVVQSSIFLHECAANHRMNKDAYRQISIMSYAYVYIYKIK